MANYLFGPILLENCSLKKTNLLDIEVEDTASMQLKNNKNIGLKIDLSFASKKNLRTITINGSKGLLRFDLKSNILDVGLFEFRSQEKIYKINSDDLFIKQINYFGTLGFIFFLILLKDIKIRK